MLSPIHLLSTAGSSLSLGEVTSGIFGSISLTAWVTVLLPQLHTNYKAGRADGLSMTFLFIWLTGDAANFVGAVLSHLAPTPVMLAGCFVVADWILIGQCFYYNNIRASKEDLPAEEVGPSEQSPLISSSAHDSPAKPSAPSVSPWLLNALSLFLVGLIGCVGWFVSFKLGLWDTTESGERDPVIDASDISETIGLALGYGSAVCYLCARIPQIMKNHREKSCEGLAILFFLLSLAGNVTYFISLLAYSQDRDYLVSAIPWFLGSVGTVGEDFIMLAQFRRYASQKAEVYGS